MKTFRLVCAKSGITTEGGLFACLKAAYTSIERNPVLVFQIYSARPGEKNPRHSKYGRYIGSISRAGFVGVGWGQNL